MNTKLVNYNSLSIYYTINLPCYTITFLLLLEVTNVNTFIVLIINKAQFQGFHVYYLLKSLQLYKLSIATLILDIRENYNNSYYLY